MPMQLTCANCGGKFSRKPSAVRDKANYCSVRCRRRIPRDADMLRRLYVDEQQTGEQIAARFGATFTTVLKVLHELGIPIRTFSDAAALTMSRRTPDQRKAGILQAQAAIRGSKRSHVGLCNRAIGIQRAGRLSEHEREVVQLLAAAGINVIPLCAVDKFNIDIGVPERRIGFELTGSNWHNASRKRAQDDAKRQTLESLGWRIIDLHKLAAQDAALRITTLLHHEQGYN